MEKGLGEIRASDLSNHIYFLVVLLLRVEHDFSERVYGNLHSSTIDLCDLHLVFHSPS